LIQNFNIIPQISKQGFMLEIKAEFAKNLTIKKLGILERTGSEGGFANIF